MSTYYLQSYRTEQAMAQLEKVDVRRIDRLQKTLAERKRKKEREIFAKKAAQAMARGLKANPW